MSETKTVKAYVRPDNTAAISCPHCGRQKSVQVDSFRGIKSRVKIKCGCKNFFTVNLEFRKRIRKRTNLRGTFINHSQKSTRGNIKIKNISVTGLEFSSMDDYGFAVDDELTIDFHLDDEQRSQVTKDVIVMNVRENSIGCEFERSGDLAFDGPLGRYVMS